MARLHDPGDLINKLRGWASLDNLSYASCDQTDDFSGDVLNEVYDAPKKNYASTNNATVRNAGAKVGRNDKCPCGSGKKYKNCCGSSSKRGTSNLIS